MNATLASNARSPDDPGLPDRRSRPLVLHALLVLVGFASLWLAEEPATTLYITGAAVLVVYPWLVALEIRRAPLWLSPLSFYLGWYTVTLGLGAIHFGNKLSERIPISFAAKTIYPDELAAGYVVYLLGTFAFHAGIQAVRPRAASSDAPSASGLGLLILWGIGLGVRLFSKDLGALGSIAGMFLFGTLSALFGFVVQRGDARHRATFWPLLAIGTLIEIALNVRTGSKALIMFSFLPVGWLFLRKAPLRRWFPILVLGLSILYLGVVAPVVSASRHARDLANENPGDRIIRTYSEGSYGDSGDVGDQVEAFLERAFDPAPTAFLYGEVERSGLRWGDTMDYLWYAFVPRFVWPDKPGVTRGPWFYAYVGGARSESEAKTSLAQSAVGELYWNFSYLGAVVGMSVLGAAFGALWRLATASPERDPVRLLLYVTLCFNTLDLSEAGSALVNVTFRAIVFIPTIFLLDRATARRMKTSTVTA